MTVSDIGSVVPAMSVLVNGSALPLAAQTDIRSLTVVEDLHALSMFTLVLYNWDLEKLEFTWSDSSFFGIGGQVRISLGYLDDLHEVMTGEITSLEPTFTADEPPTLTVRGYDYRHRLARNRKTQTFFRMKDSAIVSQVARSAGLRAVVEDTRNTLDYVVQHNQTDLEFLQRRAQLIGYEVYVREKVLYFRPPQHGRQAAATLRLGQDIIEFTPRLRTLDQVGEMTVRGWDVMKKDLIVGTAGTTSTTMGGKSSGPARTKKTFGRSGAASVDVPVPSKARADQMARGRFDDMALTYIQGEVECAGRSQLHAGTVVDIEGAGETFSGAYYLTSVTHTLTGPEGYHTRLEVRRNAT